MCVIGGYNTSNCEVFNSFSRKFTSIKSLKKTYDTYIQAVCLDKVIVVFNVPIVSGKGKTYAYNTESNEYAAVESETAETLVGVSCVKYYKN